MSLRLISKGIFFHQVRSVFWICLKWIYSICFWIHFSLVTINLSQYNSFHALLLGVYLWSKNIDFILMKYGQNLFSKSHLVKINLHNPGFVFIWSSSLLLYGPEHLGWLWVTLLLLFVCLCFVCRSITLSRILRVE